MVNNSLCNAHWSSTHSYKCIYFFLVNVKFCNLTFRRKLITWLLHLNLIFQNDKLHKSILTFVANCQNNKIQCHPFSILQFCFKLAHYRNLIFFRCLFLNEYSSVCCKKWNLLKFEKYDYLATKWWFDKFNNNID